MKINSHNTNLNLRHLRAIHAVRAEGSFARAADRLGVVPSALTETIRQLEESAGVPLFDRRMRPPQLTEAGLEFLEDTRPALEALDHALERLQESADLGRGRLALGASPSTIGDLVAPALRRFCADHPAIAVRLHDGPAEDLARMVADGELDLAIAGYSSTSPMLERREIACDPIGLVVPVDHPLTRLGRPPRLAEIDPATLIHLDEGAGTARLLADAPDLPPALKNGPLRVASTFGQLCLIRAGMGVGLLPQKAALLFDDPRLMFLSVADLRLERRISLIWPARRALSHVAARFMALCEALSGTVPESHADVD